MDGTLWREMVRGYSLTERLAIRQRIYSTYTQAPGRDFFAWVTAFLELAAGHRVLDIGCGNGAFHSTITQRGGVVAAFDVSPSAARFVLDQENVAARSHGIRSVWAFCAAAEQLPLRSAVFDSAMANFVLHNLTLRQRSAAYAEFRRVVRRGGTIVTTNHSATLLKQLRDLHARAAVATGFTPLPQAGYSEYTVASLGEFKEFFPTAQLFRFDSRLAIPSVEPVLNLYAAFMLDFIAARPPDSAHREPMLAWMAAEVGAIVAREGRFEDDISSGVFVAVNG